MLRTRGRLRIDAHFHSRLQARAHGNVIGGGDWAEDRLLPDMMRSFMAGDAVTIRNPASTRPWQHVLEPLHGYLMLAEQLYDDNEYAEAWNFGPDEDDAKPVEWLADRVRDYWGPAASWSYTAAANQLHEAGFLKLNCDKAKSRLGWRPRMSLDQALLWTVEWYKCFERGDDVRALTERTDIELRKRDGAELMASTCRFCATPARARVRGSRPLADFECVYQAGSGG